MKNNRNAPEVQEGHIRISNREKLRYQTHRKGILTLLAAGSVLLFAIVILLMTKNYTDRKIAETNNYLEKESNQYNELEKRFYERENFRAAYDKFASNLVGVTTSRAALHANEPDKLSSGLIYGVRGHILVPAASVRGQTQVYVQIQEADRLKVHNGIVMGVDEATGLGLIDVPTLNREQPLDLTPVKPALAQTILLIALPQGDPDSGNLTMGEIHSREALYTVRSGGEDTKVPIFLTSAPVYRGNDGGAAVTMEGRLAGMASSELTQRLGMSPYTAVIPGSELPRVVERILSRDEASAVKLGVQGDLVEVPSLKQPGFYVLEVEEGSTAQRGGIQPTDILLTIDGQPVTRERAIDSYLKGKKAGDSLQVTLSRLNEILSLTMKIY